VETGHLPFILFIIHHPKNKVKEILQLATLHGRILLKFTTKTDSKTCFKRYLLYKKMSPNEKNK